MSASEDESFASAEEGEREANAASGKSSKSKDSKRRSEGASDAKQSEKQKGDQQKKQKAKGQSKSSVQKKQITDQKKKSELKRSEVNITAEIIEKKPLIEKVQLERASSTVPTGPKVDSSQDSESVKSSVKDSSLVSESVKSLLKNSSQDSESVKSSLKDTCQTDVSGDKQDAKCESKVSSRTVRETTPSKIISEKKPEPAVELIEVGDQNLSPIITREESHQNDPEDQTIDHEAGGAAKDVEDKSSHQSAASSEDAARAESESESESGGTWNWGWGSSLLNAATNSLETFSSQVGEGFTTLIDTVESSLGVPNPEEMVRADAAFEPNTEPNGADAAFEPNTEPNGADAVTAQPQVNEAKEEPPMEKTAEEEEKKELSDDVPSADSQQAELKASEGGSWLSGWGISNISSMGKSLVSKSQNLMNTGFEKAETLAAGGLDILETIGRKTYTTLTEHDPGLRRAREFLHRKDEKPSLSSVLREAQSQAEEQAKREQESEEARRCNFTALFEDNQGLAHLEALEMLSNRSERKVQSLLSAMEEEMLDSIRPQLIEIKETFQQACENQDKGQEAEDTEHEFSKLVTENLSELHLGTVPDKLNKVSMKSHPDQSCLTLARVRLHGNLEEKQAQLVHLWVQESVRHWIADFYSHEEHSEISDAKEIQQHAIQSLADVTSKAVEQFHKAGELVLMQKDEEKSYNRRAQSLAKLSSVLATEVNILATKFSHCLNKIGEERNATEEINPMITNVYLEASNASGYIQDAFQLLLPVLQHAAIQSVVTGTL